MTQPTPSDVHVNRPLTNISVAFIQDASHFIARRVFQAISVKKQSDQYFTYDRSYFQRAEMKKRAPGTESAGGGYGVGTANYFCDVWALHKDVADPTRKNEDTPLNSDRDSTLWLTEQRMLRMEKEFVTNYMAPSVWDTDVTGVAGSPSGAQVKQWNDATSTPIEDMRAYRTAVHKATGMRPNVFTIGQEVWDQLADHPDIIDRIKYSGGVSNNTPAKASKEAVAALMELDEILVAGGVENTAAEGQPHSGDFIVGKTGLLTYRPRTPGLMTPAAGYVMEWNSYTESSLGQTVFKFRMEHLKSDRIEIEAAFDMHKVSGALGVYFASLVA